MTLTLHVIVRFEGRLLHFTTLFNVRFGGRLLRHVGRLYTYTIILIWRPEGPSRHDVSFGVIKPVDDHLVRLDGRVRFGNGRLGHLEGLVGGEGLGVDGVD